MKKEYLPIGTVVLLKGGEFPIMVTGFQVAFKDDDKVYDYGACYYPQGIISMEETLAFNHTSIKNILYMGYESEQDKEFKKVLNDIPDDVEDMEPNKVELLDL